ncbi:MAG: 3',5'-cyclic adenosine monophosphate phosphodiesterase CpdA [Mycoplasmataceae bacterium]|nr:MAG: 3',5'-cyclic adenosine monophosphate phosphodiesterase CpdA [Mycoplasmataceae bacterium]
MKKIRIAHLSDIHFKDSRRDEYEEVLETVYKKLRSENPNIIAITGDIFHDKTKASAYNFSDVESFLSSLTKISPVVLIPGNHDLNIKVIGSPDLLSPIIKNNKILKSPDFIYWRNSGIYNAHGIIWIVISPDGLQPSWEEVNNFSRLNNLDDYPRICLVHETIDGSLLFNGTFLRGKRLSPKDLSDYDAVLAGDIHLRQFIGKNKRAMYAGSLIQQDIGETYENHGFLIWEIELSKENFPYKTLIPKISEFNIPNKRGYLKIIIKIGEDINYNHLPNNPNYYELAYDESVKEEDLNYYIEKFTNLYSAPPRAIRLLKKFKENNKSSSLILSEAQNEAQSLSSHEKIIVEILGENNKYLKDVINLHRNYYLNTLNKERSRSRVRLLSLKFSNLYCYGKDNLIDFTKLERKISGVIASNRAGKSALIDIIVFALYDEYPRADRKSNIINDKYSQYDLLLEFEVDGKRGYIEKSGKKSRGSHFPECRLFYNNQDMTQGTSTLTCKEIEKLIGNYFDAQLTSISHQGSSTDFVHLKPNERKKSLAQLLALGSFEKLEKTIKDDQFNLNFEIKLLEKSFRGETSKEIIEKIDSTKEIYEKENIEKNSLDKRINIEKENLQEYIKEREQIFFNYCQIKNKISISKPDKTVDLKIAQEQLKKILEKMTLEENFSPEEELENYSLYDSEDNQIFDLNLQKILTRKELLDFINNSNLQKDEIFEKENLLSLKINELELEKIKTLTLLNEGLTNLKENYPKLNIDFEELKIETPDIPFDKEINDERPWPTYKKGIRKTSDEILKAKLNLLQFDKDKDSVLVTILQKLLFYSNIEIPNFDEKKGEYEELKYSFLKDEKLILNKKNLTQELEISKFKLEIAKLEENSHDSDLLEIAKLDNKQIFISFDEIFFRKEIERSKINLIFAENSQNICKQLILKDNCYGCDNTRNLFKEKDLEFLKNELKNILIESASLAIYKSKLEQIKINNLENELNEIENAQKRVNRFNQISEQRFNIVEYEKNLKEKKYWEEKKESFDTLEISTYWWLEDKNIWNDYNLALNHIQNIKNLKEKIEDICDNLIDLNISLEEFNKAKNSIVYKVNKEIFLRKIWLQEVILASKNLEIAEKKSKDICDFEMLIDELEKEEKSLNDYKEKVIICENNLNKLLNDRDNSIGLLSSLKDNLIRLDECLKYEIRRENELADFQEKSEILSSYRKILDPKTGIADQLLKKSRFYLEDEVNSVLFDCNANFKVSINEDFELNTVFDVDGDETVVSSKLSSGYQKFVLSLAFRTALWKLAEVTLPDCQFIDEGFGSCDEENLNLIIQYIKSSTLFSYSPKINFIVSHIDIMKNAIEEPLFIDVKNSMSRIKN